MATYYIEIDKTFRSYSSIDSIVVFFRYQVEPKLIEFLDDAALAVLPVEPGQVETERLKIICEDDILALRRHPNWLSKTHL